MLSYKRRICWRAHSVTTQPVLDGRCRWLIGRPVDYGRSRENGRSEYSGDGGRRYDDGGHVLKRANVSAGSLGSDVKIEIAAHNSDIHARINPGASRLHMKIQGGR